MKIKKKSKAAKISWGTNFNNKILPIAQLLGVPDTETAAQQASIQKMINQINAEAMAWQAYLDSRNASNAATEDAMTSSTDFIKMMKTKKGWTDEMAIDLDLEETNKTQDPATYRPDPKILVTGGFPMLQWKRGIARAMNIYGMLPGETLFTLIGTVTGGKFVDKRPPAKQGIFELRQYYLMGVINDVEIGQRSETVSIAYGG